MAQNVSLSKLPIQDIIKDGFTTFVNTLDGSVKSAQHSDGNGVVALDRGTYRVYQNSAGVAGLYVGNIVVDNDRDTTLAKLLADATTRATQQTFKPMANNCSLAVSFSTGTTAVQTTRTPHLSGPTGQRGILVGFVNQYLGTNQESNGLFDWNIRMGVEIDGKYIRGLSGGQVEVLCVKEWGLALFYVDVYIPPNTTFNVISRRTAADAASSEVTIANVIRGTRTYIKYSGVAPVVGDNVRIENVVGTTELNYATNGSVGYQVGVVDTVTQTFELLASNGTALNSSGFAAHVTGGTSVREYSWPYNSVGTIQNGGGNISQRFSTNAGADYTLGIGLPGGVKPATIVPTSATQVNGSGQVTAKTAGQVGSAPLLGVGALYTGGLNVAAYHGPAGVNQPGSLWAGTSAVGGYTFNSSGLVSSFSGSTGAGYDPENPAPLFCGGDGFGGAQTAVWGPQIIMGIVDDPTVPSVFLIGDSVAAYGSDDTTGDIFGSVGLYEQAIAGRGGIFKFAVSGESATGWLQNSDRQMNLLSQLYTAGMRCDTDIIALGINDFGGESLAGFEDILLGRIGAVMDKLETVGFTRHITTTVPPRTSGTYSSLAGQSAFQVGGSTANYQQGGRVQVYNDYIRTGVGLPRQAGYLDPAILLAAPGADAYRFRVDGQFTLQYSTGVAFTNDGVHPNMGAGIAYVVANLDIRCLRADSSLNLPRALINRQARSGEVGQEFNNFRAAASAVTLASNTAANVTELRLGEGMWLITGQVENALTGASCTEFRAGISQVANTFSTGQGKTVIDPEVTTTVTGSKNLPASPVTLNVPPRKTVPVYLVAQVTSSAGTIAAAGRLTATRIAEPK